MTIYTWVVTACWAVFIIYWIISGFTAKRTVGSTSRWLTIRVITLGVVIGVLGGEFSGGLTNYRLAGSADWALAGFGALLCVLGIAVAVWARVYLGRNWGMPQTIRENPELVTSGPYSYIRHPIYTGVLLAMIGTGIVAGIVWLILLLIYSVYFIYSAFQEEKLMLNTFPDNYPNYMKRTKMLIPFIF